MKAVFLSDAHLKNRSDPGYRALLRFFDSVRGGIDHLYIAGDFFDFWFCGNGLVYPEFVDIIRKLRELRDSGTGIHFCEGNHDFDLAPYFTGQLGMEVFTDWADLVLDGKRIFLSHGDTVDRNNRRYLFLRRILRTRGFDIFQRLIPPEIRWKLARISSETSKGMSEHSRDELAEKMSAFSLEKFREGFDAVILGHCHKPLLRRHGSGGDEKVFAALGDWVECRSYVLLLDGCFSLEYFEL